MSLPPLPEHRPNPSGEPPWSGPPNGSPPAPSRAKRLLVLIALIVGLLVVLMVVGSLVYSLNSGSRSGSDGGSPGATSGGTEGGAPEAEGTIDAEVAWRTSPPKVGEEALGSRSPGTWFVNGSVVRVLPDGVVAYRADNGERLWSLPLKQPRKCGVSHEAPKNLVALTFGDKCEQVGVVDIAKGQEVWRQTLPAETFDDEEFVGASVAISGNTVAVNWWHNGFGYRLSDGASLWRGESNGECWLDGYLGGPQLIARYSCESKRQVLHGLNGKGEKEWEWRVPEGARVGQFFSQDPLVLTLSAGGDGGVTDVVLIEDGKLRQKTPIETDRFQLGCSSIHLTLCAEGLVDGTTLYLPTDGHEGAQEYERTNEIIAFDLTTGEALWHVEPPFENLMVPVAVEDGKLLAYQRGDFDQPGVVLEIDLKTRKVTTRMKLPVDTKEVEDELRPGTDSGYYWSEDRFYMISLAFSRHDEPGRPALLAFS